jgi:hypothetical protein
MLSGSVMFKVPFCGSDWAAGAVISVDAPSIARLGGDPDQTLIITGKMPFEGAWVATLDAEFTLGSPEFRMLTNRHLSLTRPAEVLRNYEKLELRLGTGFGYLLDIPSGPAAPAETALDNAQVPLTVAKGKSAIVDLQGAKLTEITEASLAGTALAFQAYADGSRLRLFLSTAETASEGKFDIALKTRQGAKLSASIYVLDQQAKDGEKP